MPTNRLEAFSDGVLAIIITIMVLELKAPHDGSLAALGPLAVPLFSYLVSFLYVGIYWTNHHHLFHATETATGAVLWANLHLLFWLSLFPFVTHWVGESHLAPGATAAYGVVLLMAGLAYSILQSRIIREQGPGSVLAEAIGPDLKGKLSLAGYVVGIAAAAVEPWVSAALYVAVALVWLVPDRRIEKRLARPGGPGD